MKTTKQKSKCCTPDILLHTIGAGPGPSIAHPLPGVAGAFPPLCPESGMFENKDLEFKMGYSGLSRI